MAMSEPVLASYLPAELAATLFEEAGDALFLFDPESEQILDVNPMAQRLSGYGRQDLLRQRITYLVRSEVSGGLQRFRQACRETGSFHSQEGYLLRHQRGGVWIPVNLTLTRLHTESKTLGLVTARDVSEHRSTLAQLRTTEAELRRVLASVSDCVWSAELDSLNRITYRYYSPVVEQITGKPPEFFMSGHDRWLIIVHPEDRPQLQALRERIRAGTPRCYEESYRIIRPDGAVRWVRDSFQVSKTADPKITRLDGIVTDITVHKQAEEELAHERDLLHILMDNIPHLIYFKDRDSRFTRINRAQRDNLRIADAQAALGKTDLDYYPADLAREFFADEQRLLETGRPLIGKIERQTGVDATERWISTTKVPIRGPDGQIVGLVGVSQDVTEQRRIEDAVRASEAKYRSLIENLEQCVFLKDDQFRFVAVNRFLCRYFGVTEESVVGKTDFDLFPPELAEKFRADDTRVLGRGERLELEEQNIAHGEKRTVRVIKTPVKNEYGRNVGVLGIFWDVTEQRAAEAQLRQAQKMEAVGQLAGGIAHDFNNLLTVILGNLSLLRAEPINWNGDLELLDATEKAALRAAELTSKLLGFSRRTTLRLEPTDLNACIDETVGLLRRTIDPRIVLETGKQADLWPVQADSSQMNQVLMNLCLNARDAMPEGGRLVLETDNVSLDSDAARRHLDARAGEFVRLRVRDTGQGMPPEVLPRIFEPFFTTKGPGKGTGLGLAMVFGIVKQHQGWIDCASTLGQGTRLDIYLPRKGVTETAAAPGTPHRTPRHGHETILLVDDDPMIRDLGRTVLRSYGYQVLQARDGAEAVALYAQECGRINLVLLDLTMPNLSGQDAFRQLLKLDPEVRVVFVSGYSADHLNGLDSDRILGFLGKPFRPEELAQAVRNALDRAPVSR